MFLRSITYFTFPKATIYQAISTPPHLLIFDLADQRNCLIFWVDRLFNIIAFVFIPRVFVWTFIPKSLSEWIHWQIMLHCTCCVLLRFLLKNQLEEKSIFFQLEFSLVCQNKSSSSGKVTFNKPNQIMLSLIAELSTNHRVAKR